MFLSTAMILGLSGSRWLGWRVVVVVVVVLDGGGLVFTRLLKFLDDCS